VVKLIPLDVKPEVNINEGPPGQGHRMSEKEMTSHNK